MKKVFVIGVAAASLAACNQASLLGPPTSPHRKPGLWEQSFQTDRRPTPMVSEACYDATSDLRSPVLPNQPKRANACAKFSISQQGSGYVVDSDCSFMGASGPHVTNHAVISGDFNSKYTVTNTANIQNSPNAARNGQHTSTMTATYKGACPADIGPGQVKMPNGDVIDMAQLRRGFGGAMMRRPNGANVQGNGGNAIGQGGGNRGPNGGGGAYGGGPNRPNGNQANGGGAGSGGSGSGGGDGEE